MTKHLFFFSQAAPTPQLLDTIRHLEETRIDGEDVVGHVLPWALCPAEIERQIIAAPKKPSYWCVNGRIYLKVWPGYFQQAFIHQTFGAEVSIGKTHEADPEKFIQREYVRASRAVQSISRCQYDVALGRVLADPDVKLKATFHKEGDPVLARFGREWRPGVISRVEGEYYAVQLNDGPELVGFKPAELRLTYRKGAERG